MTLSEARQFFDHGNAKNAYIIPQVGGAGWLLKVSIYKGPKLVDYILERQRGGQCVYKTIDAAFSAAFDIGFREVTIEHNGLLGF